MQIAAPPERVWRQFTWSVDTPGEIRASIETLCTFSLEPRDDGASTEVGAVAAAQTDGEGAFGIELPPPGAYVVAPALVDGPGVHLGATRSIGLLGGAAASE